MNLHLLKITLTLIISIHAWGARHSDTTQGPLPLLEVGGGAVWSKLPDYPGSRYEKKLFVPFPTALYRGESLRADEEGGVRNRFIYTDRYEVNLSIGGSLPTKSKDNPDRAGMPNLATVVELGPGLIFNLLESKKNGPYKLAINLPTRMALSLEDWSFTQRGFVFNPFLYYIHNNFLTPSLRLFTSLDLRFASKKNNDYYYGVGPLQSNNFRPEYQSKNGFTGGGLSLGLSYEYQNRWTFFGGGYYSNYRTSINRAAYLLQKRETLSLGIGIMWWFYHSKEKGVR